MNKITNEFVMEKLAWGAKRPTPIRELMEAPQLNMSDKDTPKPGTDPRMTDQRNLNPPAPRVQMSGVRPTLNQSRMDQDVQDFGSKLTSGGLGQRISESHGQAINAVMDKERADGEYGRNKNKITTGTTRGVVGSKGGPLQQAGNAVVASPGNTTGSAPVWNPITGLEFKDNEKGIINSQVTPPTPVKDSVRPTSFGTSYGQPVGRSTPVAQYLQQRDVERAKEYAHPTVENDLAYSPHEYGKQWMGDTGGLIGGLKYGTGAVANTGLSLGRSIKRLGNYALTGNYR